MKSFGEVSDHRESVRTRSSSYTATSSVGFAARSSSQSLDPSPFSSGDGTIPRSLFGSSSWVSKVRSKSGSERCESGAGRLLRSEKLSARRSRSKGSWFVMSAAPDGHHGPRYRRGQHDPCRRTNAPVSLPLRPPRRRAPRPGCWIHTPSFISTASTCVSTVVMAMSSCSAIWRLVKPLFNSSTTRPSIRVRPRDVAVRCVDRRTPQARCEARPARQQGACFEALGNCLEVAEVLMAVLTCPARRQLSAAAHAQRNAARWWHRAQIALASSKHRAADAWSPSRTATRELEPRRFADGIEAVR